MLARDLKRIKNAENCTTANRMRNLPNLTNEDRRDPVDPVQFPAPGRVGTSQEKRTPIAFVKDLRVDFGKKPERSEPNFDYGEISQHPGAGFRSDMAVEGPSLGGRQATNAADGKGGDRIGSEQSIAVPQLREGAISARFR